LDLDACDLGLGSNHRGHHEVLLNPLSREHWGGVDGVGFELSYDAPLGYASDWSFGQTGWSLVPSLPTSFDDYQQVTSHHDLGKQPHGDLPSGDDWFLPWSSSPFVADICRRKDALEKVAGPQFDFDSFPVRAADEINWNTEEAADTIGNSSHPTASTIQSAPASSLRSTAGASQESK
jgi:hypothetical protein